MATLKHAAAVIAAILSVMAISVPADANRRCGYDRYGYHAPDFSGCYRYYREGWGFYPPYGHDPEMRYVAPPAYAVSYGACFLDNGYDLRVHLVCPRRW